MARFLRGARWHVRADGGSEVTYPATPSLQWKEQGVARQGSGSVRGAWLGDDPHHIYERRP
jgi:hypothetical protein